MAKTIKRLPFDLDKAKAGAKIQTKSGKGVRIICFDRNNKFCPIVALVQDNPYYEDVFYYTSNGKSDLNRDSAYDLQIVEEVEVPDRWRDRNERVCGYIIDTGEYEQCFSNFDNCSEPPLEEQADVVDAYAKLMQIIKHDTRFGGVIADEEWENGKVKYAIFRAGKKIKEVGLCHTFEFLTFHTKEQADLFLIENEDLIKKFFML